ncbi:MAG: hypothetical protein SGPRY_003551 [Prymnesium sp.]
MAADPVPSPCSTDSAVATPKEPSEQCESEQPRLSPAFDQPQSLATAQEQQKPRTLSSPCEQQVRRHGSRVIRELLDSEGFALQWNRDAPRFTVGNVLLSTPDVKESGVSDHSRQLPPWAGGTRRCLRLSGGGAHHVPCSQATIHPVTIEIESNGCESLTRAQLEKQFAKATAARLTAAACGFEAEAAARYFPERDDFPDKIILALPTATAAGLAAAQPWWMGADYVCATCGRCFKTKHGCTTHMQRFCKGPLPTSSSVSSISQSRGMKGRQRGRPAASKASELAAPPVDGANDVSSGMEDVYRVERLLAVRAVVRGKRKKQFLVRWEGWSDKFNTWEDENHILDVLHA